jgi:hypothetical protein
MLPTTQLIFPGSYAADAPSDMIAGLGRDGQIVSISQSSGLVFIRMGEAPSSTSSVPTIFCNQIWQKINELDCNLAIDEQQLKNIAIGPNPATNSITITNIRSENYECEIFNIIGNSVMKVSNQNTIDISKLAAGVYMVLVRQGNQTQIQKLIKK